MSNLRISNKTKPVSERQIARLVVNSLYAQGLLTELEADDALASNGAAAMLFDVADPTGPNGMRSFIVEVREVS